MAKDKKNESSWGMGKNLGTIFVLILMTYVCVALLPGLNQQVADITGNSTNASTMVKQAVTTIVYNVGSPTWVLYLGLFLIIGLGITWYFGFKRKFSWLGDEETESKEA